MFRRRTYRNTHVAWCYATEDDGAVLVRDIWFFNPRYVTSVSDCWRQIQEWIGQYSSDPNFQWGIAVRPSNM